MTKNRFKQVCNYFYDLKNGCCGKMFESDIIDDINMITDGKDVFIYEKN